MTASAAGSAVEVRVVDRIAEFVAGLNYSDLPATVVSTVVDAVTDALGCGLAGAREPLAGSIRRALDIVPATSGAADPVIGVDAQASWEAAAVYNGAVIHALDFDDTNHPAYAHPSSALVPVLLDAARREDADGELAVAAYVAGLELEARLGGTLNMAHYLEGWHPTGTFGTLAAAAAASVLYRLDVDQCRTALGIASSMASGVRANFGTMTKPLHAGLAARNGLQAARLAAAGLTASIDAVDGTFGYFDVFGTVDPGGALSFDTWTDLGREWATVSPYGLALKPFPSCGATHPAIEAALQATTDLRERAIAKVTVGTTPHSASVLIYSRPRTGLEGKFSMEYCVAAALTTGRVDLDSFTDAAVNDPRIHALIDAVEVVVDPTLSDNTEWGAQVEVQTVDGESIRHRVVLATGKRDRWPSVQDLELKFVSCAAPTLGEPQAHDAFTAIRELPQLATLRELGSVVRPTKR